MLTVLGTEQVRLTNDERDALRRMAAKNGVIIKTPRTKAELLGAAISALPEAILDKLAAALDRADNESPSSR